MTNIWLESYHIEKQELKSSLGNKETNRKTYIERGEEYSNSEKKEHFFLFW